MSRPAKAPELRRAGRRRFLRTVSGAAGGAALLVAGCDADVINAQADVILDFSRDMDVLNYVYLLEQLKAAFYEQAVAEAEGFPDEVQATLETLAAHEDIHRQALQAILGDDAISDLTLSFEAVDFGDQERVLEEAQVLEDLSVAAYNGAGPLLEDEAYLAAFASTASVEARHAAVLRALTVESEPSQQNFGGTFAIDGEYVIAEGLDEARGPREVLQEAVPFIEQTIAVRGL